jgi:hypothetical protein
MTNAKPTHVEPRIAPVDSPDEAAADIVAKGWKYQGKRSTRRRPWPIIRGC